MKQYLILFIIFFSTLSCAQNEEEYPENPKWLKDKIEQMAASAMPGIEVIAYKWNDGYYYHIMNPISSCMFCDFYDYRGNKIVWTDDDITDFNKHGKIVKVVWKKGY